MTPQEIHARIASLRDAGAALRKRPAHETLGSLERVLDTWCDPSSAWRRELETKLPAATGFRSETVREGLAHGLGSWTGTALREVVRREIGGADRLDGRGNSGVSGFDVTSVLLAGSIPMPTLLALLAPLVLRSPVLAKAASRDPITAPLIARSIAECDPNLGRCVDVIDFRSDDTECLHAVLDADCVVATGSDETVARVAKAIRPTNRLVVYGHRLSVAVLGTDAMQGRALARAMSALAFDIALWDQLGCLSPISLYAVGGDAQSTGRIVTSLAEALENAESRWPRGSIDPGAAAAFAHEREAAELRRAAGQRVRVLAGDASEWCVVCEEDAAPRPAPLHRFMRVHPVADLASLRDSLSAWNPHLSAVAIEGFGAGSPALARSLATLGASRVCAFGSLQAPPLGWHHDGQPVLVPLARFADIEL